MFGHVLAAVTHPAQPGGDCVFAHRPEPAAHAGKRKCKPAGEPLKVPQNCKGLRCRSHGYLDRKAMRITGSRRLDPNTLHQSNEAIPVGQVVFVYCTCVREATSVRAARDLEKNGIRVAVIKGGLRAWKKAGLPIEAVPHDEVALLPVFR